MKLYIELPDYDDGSLEAIWDEKAQFTITCNDREVAIMANSEGLMALGKQMIYMAINDFPWGSHLHYDEFVTGKKVDSVELIIGKI